MSESVSRIGIVLRTKNRPNFLRRALADILAQKFDLWRVAIVNDGGDPDAVEHAISSLSERTRAKIVVRHNDAPTGRSAAANQGVALLDTEFIVLHDDDDLWDPHFLGETVDWLDGHPEHVGVVARTEIVYEEEADGTGEFVEVGRAPFWADMEQVTYTDLLKVNRVVPIGYLYRRSIHDVVGGYREDLHAAEDWEFNLRVALHHQIGFMAEPALAFWMQRVGVEGEAGNSMFALAHEHERYDHLIRDEALVRHDREYGPGLSLYLTRFIQDTVRETIREEIRQELDRRPSDLDRIRGRLRGLMRKRRS